MKKYLLFLLIDFSLLFFNSSYAQQITFQKTYGGTGYEQGFSVRQTADSGFIIIGGTTSFGSGGEVVYLIKSDANGDTLWTKTFGHGSGYSGRQTIDGGYIIAGTTVDSLGFEDIYMAKTDFSGNLLWAKTFGGTGNDESKSVQQTTDDGYIIAGATNSFGTGDYDVYLIKTDSVGNYLWTKTFGGSNYDDGYSVQQTTDGGYIIAGSTESFGASTENAYLIKTDSTGNLLWSKTLGLTVAVFGLSVQQNTDGGYIICGYTSVSGAGHEDVYLIKTNVNGNLLWSKTFGTSVDDVGFSIQQSKDGGYIIAGNTAINVYLVKTDSTGNLLWSKSFGGIGYDWGYSVQQTFDEGYIVSGRAVDSLGVTDIYLIKTDSLGNSGCNQGNPATIVTSPATQVTSPATIVTTPTTIVTTPTTIVGSGGIVTTLCSSVGINQITTENSISIFPNPVQKELIIKNEKLIINSVEIVNIVGKKVYSLQTRNSIPIAIGIPTKIDVSNLASGIYFVKITTDTGSVVKKFVKE